MRTHRVAWMGVFAVACAVGSSTACGGAGGAGAAGDMPGRGGGGGGAGEGGNSPSDNEFLGAACGSDPDSTDWDGDGLSNNAEIVLGTDPCNPDTDGDGIPDPIDPDPAVIEAGGDCTAMDTDAAPVALAPGQPLLSFPHRVPALIGNAWEYSKGSSSPFNNSGLPLTRKALKHRAIDFIVGEGTAVHASCSGYAMADAQGIGSTQAYGNMVILKCDSDALDGSNSPRPLFVLYAHLSSATVPFKAGKRLTFHTDPAGLGVHVSKGDVVGHSGHTGAVWPHLHMQTYVDRYAVRYDHAVDPYDLRALTASGACHSARWYPSNVFACNFTGCGASSLWDSCPVAAACTDGATCGRDRSQPGAYAPTAAEYDGACASQCPAGFDRCGSAASCGNGTLDPGEECDGASLGGSSCTTLGKGFTGGALACNAGACTYNTSGCKSATCGNGNLDPAEQCDGANLNGMSCVSLGMGFTGGSLACSSGSCTFDTSGCKSAACGNGNLDPAEQCDGANLNGKTCTTLGQGYSGGSLSCNPGSCTFNTSSCTSCAPSCAGKCGGASDGCASTCNAACQSGTSCVSMACQSCSINSAPSSGYTPNFAAETACSCTAADTTCHTLYRGETLSLSADGWHANLQFTKANNGTFSAGTSYWIVVGDPNPSCSLLGAYTNLANVRASGVVGAGGATLTVNSVPIWKDQAAFDADAQGASKAIFLITDGAGSVGVPTWFEKQALSFTKACP